MDTAHSSAVEHAPAADIHARYPDYIEEDEDFLMEHLNDPNYDLRKPLRPRSSNQDHSSEHEKKSYHSDTESFDRYSDERADSRNSTAVDFDECVYHFLISGRLLNHLLANLPIQKYEQQSLMLTIR